MERSVHAVSCALPQMNASGFEIHLY